MSADKLTADDIRHMLRIMMQPAIAENPDLARQVFADTAKNLASTNVTEKRLRNAAEVVVCDPDLLETLIINIAAAREGRL